MNATAAPTPLENIMAFPRFVDDAPVRRAPATASDWTPSPTPGVERVVLEREGDEIAKATSLVRYAAGTVFPEHLHGGGEEILVLAGVFSDGSGDYAAGSYLRSPPGSRHSPSSAEGCLLLVKLWQFLPDDFATVRVHAHERRWFPGLVPGLTVCPLHEHGAESVALVRWAPHTNFNPHVHPGGEEILVIEGYFEDETGRYPAGSWIKNPRFSCHQPHTGDEGALIYVKVGHVGAATLWEQRSG